MLHAFEGTFDAGRSLSGRATAFDMTDLDFDIVRDALGSNQMGLSFHARLAARGGSIDETHLDPENLLWHIAAAMEADGIRFKLELLDADGAARVTHESDH